MEFSKHWHLFCPSIKEKASYLTRTTPIDTNNTKTTSSTKIEMTFLFSPIPDATNLFSLEIDCNTLSSIVECLEYILSNYKNNNDDVFDSTKSISSFLYDWLCALTECGRFSIIVLFLSARQKKILSFLLDELTCFDYDLTVYDIDDIAVLRKKFAL